MTIDDDEDDDVDDDAAMMTPQYDCPQILYDCWHDLDLLFEECMFCLVSLKIDKVCKVL